MKVNKFLIDLVFKTNQFDLIWAKRFDESQCWLGGKEEEQVAGQRFPGSSPSVSGHLITPPSVSAVSCVIDNRPAHSIYIFHADTSEAKEQTIWRCVSPLPSPGSVIPTRSTHGVLSY